MSDLGITVNLPPTNPIDRVEPSQNTDQKRKDNRETNERGAKKDQKEQKKSKQVKERVPLSKKKIVIYDNDQDKEKPNFGKKSKGELIDIRV